MTKIAILGLGVVGSGVAEVVTRGAAAERKGDMLHIKHILDVRDIPANPYKDLMTRDFAVIENDPEVTVVAETIGGAGAAYEFTRRALRAGKSVVTANKELVATRGVELLRMARDNGVRYLFEASVGGGIPIIRPLVRCLAANCIAEITGILNGTCNYILTRMAADDMPFADALAKAQALGFAERDPTADIEGHDTCRKICILAALAFGKHVYPDSTHTEGITAVTVGMMREAQAAGYAVKLVGRTVRRADGTPQVVTAPHLIPAGHPLHNVSDEFNAILVTGDATGEVMFYGKGAGGLPTASAVVADILDCASGAGSTAIWWDDAPAGAAPAEPEGTWHTFEDGAKMRVLTP